MRRVLKSSTRIVLLVLVLLAGSVVGVQAQRGNFSTENMRNRFSRDMEDTLQKLALDESTTEKARAILSANIEARMKIMEDARENGWNQSIRESVQKMNIETRKQLAGVLSEEQLKRYRKIRSEKAAGRRGRDGKLKEKRGS